VNHNIALPIGEKIVFIYRIIERTIFERDCNKIILYPLLELNTKSYIRYIEGTIYRSYWRYNAEQDNKIIGDNSNLKFKYW